MNSFLSNLVNTSQNQTSVNTVTSNISPPKPNVSIASVTNIQPAKPEKNVAINSNIDHTNSVASISSRKNGEFISIAQGQGDSKGFPSNLPSANISSRKPGGFDFSSIPNGEFTSIAQGDSKGITSNLPSANMPTTKYIQFDNFTKQIPNTDKCGIKYSKMYDNLAKISNMVAPTYGLGDTELINVILNDKFYNSVNDIAHDINNIKFDQIQCLGDNNKESICRHSAIDRIQLTDVENAITILEKYSPVIKDLYSNMVTNLSEYAKY
jgi:hypothetical protein